MSLLVSDGQSINSSPSLNYSSRSNDVHRQSSDYQGQCSPAKTKKAKRIRFLCNGDRFSKGVVMAVNSERYRSFDSLLTDLTRAFSSNVNLPSGVRILYSIEGKKISSIDELQDGKLYVCSGLGDTFKKVDYQTLLSNSPKIKPARSFSRISSANNHTNNVSRLTSNTVRARIIVFIRSGNRPRKVLRLLLNKRNSPSFDHALSTITDAVKLDTGAARKIFTSKGIPVTCVEEFFSGDDVFFVYGSERIPNDDFELDLEEQKAVMAQKKGLRRTGGELKSGTHCFDESGHGVPNLPNKSKNQKASKRLELPQKLSAKYSVGSLLGDGNFAVVRKCTERLRNVEYALKIIDKSKCAGGKEEMIENEVSILRSVKHPNIIQLIAEYDTQPELFLVMELVKGGDLFDAISRAVKFPEEDAQVMTRALASALSYLHERSIVHRDIKPENLLVEMEGDKVRNLKVADFGLAQRVDGPLYAVCGTPTYVAPEILTENGYGLEIDVWAMGVILYILLCGFPPFVSANNDQEELFDDILSGQYTFPSPYWDPISEPAKDLVSLMLQSNPSLRFSPEDVLDHPWLDV